MNYYLDLDERKSWPLDFIHSITLESDNIGLLSKD